MKTILIVFIAIFSLETYAQDTVPLLLSEAVEQAVRNNREVVLANIEKERAASRFGLTNAVLLPQITASYTAVTTDNPLNAFGFKLQQQSVTPNDFSPQLLNNPSSTQNYAAKVEVNQPLLNLDMVWQRRAAGREIDIYHYKASRTKEFVAFEVSKSFLQLQLAQDAVHVLEESLLNADSILVKAENYFKEGLLQKSDLLIIKVQAAGIQSKLEEARNNVQNTSDYLSLLMGVNAGAIYSVELLEKYDAANLNSTIPEGRADIRAMTSAVKAQAIMVNAARMSYLPRLNAFGNYMFNDGKASGFGSSSYLIGAQLSWTLFNATSSHYKIAEQKLALESAEQQLAWQREQSQVELNRAWRRLSNAQFDLEQRETSVAQAAEGFRIRNDRFTLGLVSATDLLQSQSLLFEQRLLRSEALCNYNVAIEYINFLTTVSEK